MQKSVLDVFRNRPDPKTLQQCLQACKEAGVLGGNQIAIKKALQKAVEDELLRAVLLESTGTWTDVSWTSVDANTLIYRGPNYPNAEESVIGSMIFTKISSAPKGKAGGSQDSLPMKNL